MEIFELLQQNGSAEVSELAERFGVTMMTIRRDFSLFEQQGLIVTSYGGAALKQGAGIEPSFALKQGYMTSAKQRIAQKAVEYIEDGDSIILDCGTTPLTVLKYIEKKRITVITNSWPAVNYLHGNSRVSLYLAPGKYDELSAGAVDAMTAAFYQNFRADIVLVSTEGFCPEYGATVPTPTDASVKEALMLAGKKKLLLVDSSKIGKTCLCRHALPEQFDVVITDDALPADTLQALRGRCRQVDVV